MRKLKFNATSVIVFGDRTRYTSSKIFYPFHQNPEMFYLSKINEPNAAMIIHKGKTELYLKHRSNLERKWEGIGITEDVAKSQYGMDSVHHIDEFPARIMGLLSSGEKIIGNFPTTEEDGSQHSVYWRNNNKWRQMREHCHQSGVYNGNSFLKPILDQSRLYKTHEEQANMKRACELAGIGFRNTWAKSKSMTREQQFAATFEYYAVMEGANKLAYVPVVAGRNENSCIIHYTTNHCDVRQGDLLLMDAGVEYNGYCSDITRTFPVSGRFSESQREVYQSLLNVQNDLILSCTNEMSLDDIYEMSVEKIQKNVLIETIGMNFWDARSYVHQIYPHHVGHWLGIEVHDCSAISTSHKLHNNIAFTVEPGIYLSTEENWINCVPEKFRGISIRIEDDLVMRNGTAYNLSDCIPKTVEEIEKCMK